MAAAFGTSGLRGLVTDLRADVIADYTRAFLSSCPYGAGVFVGRDLRGSSETIAQWVIAAARAEGVCVQDCAMLPTPALALAAISAQSAAIMVTGSHIPADRNGLKFYTPQGEITKTQETAIVAALGRASAERSGDLSMNEQATKAYIQRYITAFGAQALRHQRIGVYQHSSAARDILTAVINGLGATAVPLGRSDTFIPIDTEALDPDLQSRLSGWCQDHSLDAVISTDGDGDRPLLADQTGAVIKGDILGLLTAQYLRADIVCTPISSNSIIQTNPTFHAVHLTKIGSPHVIAAMQAAKGSRIVGFEPNGGFLIGFDGPVRKLMTRDALLPILAPLILARSQGLAALVADLPPRFTAADRLADIDMAKAAQLIADLSHDQNARDAFFGDIAKIDTTDGLRVTLRANPIIHLRASGNAPEFRCYTEADSPAAAASLLQATMTQLAQILH